MALDLGGNKKKQNGKSKYSIVELSLFKPGKKKYSEFDYEEIRKKQLKEDDSSGDDERFHDREALEIVKRLEAKYGGKKDKKGRRLCFGTEDDYMDKRAGYDLEDDFIDDSEAYDELIPSTMDTVKGGFYVNRGKLEFKTKHEEVNDSDISDSEELPQKKATKRSQLSSDEDVDVMEDNAPSDMASTSDGNTSDIPSSFSAKTTPRMAGAPPTKVRRIALCESANQRAANAIKKRLVGMPPTLLKRKVFQTFATRKDNDASGSPRIISGEAILPRSDDKVEAVSLSSSLSLPTSKSPEKPASDNLPLTEACNSTNIAQTTADSTTSDTCNSNAGTSPPKKRPLAPMTETLSNMIAEFKRCTNNLALPGQKKRLQNIHVDMVIAIEEQCLKDGYSLHEKARVAHSLADYCGIQKNSLYARCIKRRDEHKNGAPNLAFLAKSSSDGKGNSSIFPSSSTKSSCLAVGPTHVNNKATGSAILSTNASKSTLSSNSVPSAPTRSNGPSQMPSTSTMSSPSLSSTTKTSLAPVITSSPSITVVENPVTPSSTKSSQSWTSQRKLAAQAMITNVAALLPLNERLGDIQEILKKVVNETITYDDFLKWHEKSKKSICAKPGSDNKGGVNYVKNNLSTSNRAVNAGISAEPGVAAQSKSSPSCTSSLVKRISLAQAMATAKLPPRTRPLALTSAQISEKFESDKQTTLRAVATAIDNSKIAHKKKCEAAMAAGKPAPRFDFLWTENLARALKTQLDLYWSVLLSSDSYAKSADGIVTVFAKEIFPYFRGEIKLSRLLVEYTRRSPEKAFLLSCPSVQKLLKDENIDLNNITVLVKKEKSGDDSGTLKANSSTPYKPILPVRSSTSDEIQTSSRNDADVVVIEHSTSNASTSSGDVAASTSSATSSKQMNFNEMGLNMTASQMAEISSAMHHLTSLTSDPQQLLVLQQALLMQVMTKSQSEAKKKQADEKKKDEDKKKKQAEQEKDSKKRNKDERKMKLVSQKKELADSAKEKLMEEKRLRLEEEKRQKLAEKARKVEEERKKRLEEQAERERVIREEKERLLKEAAEKKRQEEEERRRLESIRIKVEEEKAKELEQQRQAELREEERKAAQLLEEEILMEEVSSSEVPPEMKLALEEEEQAESIRLKKQEEQVAAVRAANLAAQSQLVHPNSTSDAVTTKVTYTPTSTLTPEQKPPTMSVSKSQGKDNNPVGYSITQQSNVVCSPVTPAIHSSPQYSNPGSYGLPSSQGSNNPTMSPHCMISMTPPAHRSPVVHQQHVVQSPQQHQQVDSPLSNGQHSNSVTNRSAVQSMPCQQPTNQHVSPATIDHLDNRHSFTQPQSHVPLNHNAFVFGMQQQQQHQHQQQRQPQQQQYSMQKQNLQHQSQQQQSMTFHQSVQPQQPIVQHQPMLNHSMQTQGQPQQPQQLHQPMQQQQMQINQQQQMQMNQQQQMQMNQQQSTCISGQYQSQMCQQQMMDQQQRLALQQQRARDMYMLQHQHQQLSLQRQQQQQQQQQPQAQQQFTVQGHDHRAYQMLQQQPTYQSDMRQQEIQQQQMINQYAHHQQQNQNPFGY